MHEITDITPDNSAQDLGRSLQVLFPVSMQQAAGRPFIASFCNLEVPASLLNISGDVQMKDVSASRFTANAVITVKRIGGNRTSSLIWSAFRGAKGDTVTASSGGYQSDEESAFEALKLQVEEDDRPKSLVYGLIPDSHRWQFLFDDNGEAEHQLLAAYRFGILSIEALGNHIKRLQPVEQEVA